jgi:3-deoxy-D-manno-octulosonic-acid transferase
MAGNRCWAERWGLGDEVGSVDVWVHAASVGEVRVIANLVDYLREQQPEIRVHVTTMTTTGQRTARDLLGDIVSVSYLPLDSPAAVRRTLKRVRPRLMVIAETEIWPNLVEGVQGRGIPVVMVNARMTRRAFRRYQRVSGFMQKLLKGYDRFFCKSEEDAARYRALGANEEQAVVAGDMKFDTPLPDRSEERIARLRRDLGISNGDFLMVAGSTREGEEDLLVDMFRSLRDRHPDIRLLLAPRHVERSDDIRRLVDRHDIPLATYPESSDGVTLVDRVGLLNELYLAADLAFVGGTLVNVGGHNLLEPVWAGTPVVYGPSLDNVTEAADYIEAHDYGARVEDIDQLSSVIDAVKSGQRRFRIKSANDIAESATAQAGRYILSRLDSA